MIRIYNGIPIYVTGEEQPFPSATFAPIPSAPRSSHPDPVVEALLSQAWDGEEPLNAHDDAERIVAIVRRAIADNL